MDTYQRKKVEVQRPMHYRFFFDNLYRLSTEWSFHKLLLIKNSVLIIIATIKHRSNSCQPRNQYRNPVSHHVKHVPRLRCRRACIFRETRTGPEMSGNCSKCRSRKGHGTRPRVTQYCTSSRKFRQGEASADTRDQTVEYYMRHCNASLLMLGTVHGCNAVRSCVVSSQNESIDPAAEESFAILRSHCDNFYFAVGNRIRDSWSSSV